MSDPISDEILKDVLSDDNGLSPFNDSEKEVSKVESPTHSADENSRAIVALESIDWVPLLKKVSINIIIPFINGVMLGFGEIIAHEVGLLWGWRTANVIDPSLRPIATNPNTRRRWLFGFI